MKLGGGVRLLCTSWLGVTQVAPRWCGPGEFPQRVDLITQSPRFFGSASVFVIAARGGDAVMHRGGCYMARVPWLTAAVMSDSVYEVPRVDEEEGVVLINDASLGICKRRERRQERRRNDTQNAKMPHQSPCLEANKDK
ncbi:hypothetical protein WMF27_33250 [Sorangium sp. So ce281]|uniref:hypothetical protein n=1 Tax=unclassified Sorangium TaxID=2621164 RepID=UPI003F6316D0